ncbi:caspase domain-containing protein [Mycena alexandri]|uniref:Caspase domain-containing protein n=1 Tax=Mycena alexandri TaxID=1745969 RepID=A0AAD6X226_9AGAR|nr:caspase domain-containing protein [Mycena alexandri]
MTLTYQLGELQRNSRCPVFAFIIGIDEYSSNTIPNLKGCVNDAQTMKAYLTHQFCIPDSQIAFLTNKDATRRAILQKFRTHLIDNSAIQKDDSIIIYYAGHGSGAPAPDSWPSTHGRVKTFVPHDEREKTLKGEVTHGIPDRTLNLLLEALASAKGNNITVILDCSHSATGTGSPSGSGIFPIPRFVETLLPIPEKLDVNLLGARAGQVSLPPGISHNFMDSHVLLAACREQQRARECLSAAGEPCGFFTDSLIKALCTLGPNRISYANLVDLLPRLPNQHPQCEGENKHRFLFEGEGGAVYERRVYTLKVKDNDIVEANAGSVDGVVVGTQFLLETDVNCLLVAESVNLDSSVLIPTSAAADIQHGARVIVSHWKNDAAVMKVYVHTSEDPPLAVSDVAVPDGLGANFLVVDSLEAADLAIRRSGDEEFIITRLDAKIPRYTAPTVALGMPLNILPTAVDSVAHFNYFLGKQNGRSSDNLFASGSDNVRLEMYQLDGEYGARVPNSAVGNLIIDNEARFRLEPDGKYGFAIVNESARDLFPYLFYFDPSTYSIDAWYLPESHDMFAPLPAKLSTASDPSRITVGYGASGGYAFQFVVPEHLTSDTGFLKLFVSTKYFDLKRIEQLAAVDAATGTPDAQEPRPKLEAEGEMWAAIGVAMTMYTGEDPHGL